MKFPTILCMLAALSSALGQEKPNDFLLVSVGESARRYSDVADHLQGLLAGAAGFEEANVEILESSSIESLADGFYDPNAADIALRAKVAEGFGKVILIPTIITTPTRTIEYREFNGGPTNVYDDAPVDNEYFAPEVFYEGCTQLSKLILGAESTPMVFLPANADEAVADYGPVMYRVANGVGMDLIPGAYALEEADTTNPLEADYLYACSIFTKLTGLNANESTYSPLLVLGGRATVLANIAETTVNFHGTAVHYTTSYENDGAVVYRNLDVTGAPFNDVVRYLYKGSSTQDWTSDALTLIINSNAATTKASRKLGTRNGESFRTRFWHPDDIGDQGFKFNLDPDQAAFMYVSGSWRGAPAQEVIDLDQENMIPFAFDWIKSFALSPAVSGTASTRDALDYHSCTELYFNYAERGWKLIPLTIGMGRLNEAIPDFVASDDALHSSDPLVFMNAYMMLSSALGVQFPLPADVPPEEIHRGSYTTEEINRACLIGHELIKEMAFLSETGAYVPESDMEIVTDALPLVQFFKPYNARLSAIGGDAIYTWEVVSEGGLPDGLSLSPVGVLSGTVTDDYGSRTVVFRVSDGTGAFAKVGLRLATELPQGDVVKGTEIFAAESTDYGTDAVATMTSELLTAPDGLATFRVALSVDPKAGTSVTSDANQLWGINSGEDNSSFWTTFEGSSSEFVDSISNIRIVDFNANGGTLTTGNFKDFTFKTVEVRNGANRADRVKIVAGGTENSANGQRMASDPAVVDLQDLAQTTAVSNFTLANGNLGNSGDRWNIRGISVGYTVQMPFTDNFTEWAAGFGLEGLDALETADVENGGAGDGYANLLEFALGTDPTVDDAGTKETVSRETSEGVPYFVYEYERRTDRLESGLSYSLVTTSDLVTPTIVTPFDITVGDPSNGFETVKTRYLTDEDAMFIRLQVDKE